MMARRFAPTLRSVLLRCHDRDATVSVGPNSFTPLGFIRRATTEADLSAEELATSKRHLEPARLDEQCEAPWA